jgi:hypothetical protein
MQKGIKKDHQLICSGHSMGAALAAVLGMYLQVAKFPLKKVVTFGQPRVTNGKGAKLFKDLPYLRVGAKEDLVTKLPPVYLTKYRHMGHKLQLIGDDQFEYLIPDSENSLENDSEAFTKEVVELWNKTLKAANSGVQKRKFQKLYGFKNDQLYGEGFWGPHHKLLNYLRKLNRIHSNFP